MDITEVLKCIKELVRKVENLSAGQIQLLSQGSSTLLQKP
jgi:hypothetical protein